MCSRPEKKPQKCISELISSWTRESYRTLKKRRSQNWAEWFIARNPTRKMTPNSDTSFSPGDTDNDLCLGDSVILPTTTTTTTTKKKAIVFAYLPVLVMIISVPSSLNLSHSSFVSRWHWTGRKSSELQDPTMVGRFCSGGLGKDEIKVSNRTRFKDKQIVRLTCAGSGESRSSSDTDTLLGVSVVREWVSRPLSEDLGSSESLHSSTSTSTSSSTSESRSTDEFCEPVHREREKKTLKKREQHGLKHYTNY